MIMSTMMIMIIMMMIMIKIIITKMVMAMVMMKTIMIMMIWMMKLMLIMDAGRRSLQPRAASAPSPPRPLPPCTGRRGELSQGSSAEAFWSSRQRGVAGKSTHGRDGAVP